MSAYRLFKCPVTGNGIKVDYQQSIVRVDNSEIVNPVVDGIIDFCPNSKDKVSDSYDSVAGKYDFF